MPHAYPKASHQAKVATWPNETTSDPLLKALLAKSLFDQRQEAPEPMKLSAFRGLTPNGFLSGTSMSLLGINWAQGIFEHQKDPNPGLNQPLTNQDLLARLMSTKARGQPMQSVVASPTLQTVAALDMLNQTKMASSSTQTPSPLNTGPTQSKNDDFEDKIKFFSKKSKNDLVIGMGLGFPCSGKSSNREQSMFGTEYLTSSVSTATQKRDWNGFSSLARKVITAGCSSIKKVELRGVAGTVQSDSSGTQIGEEKTTMMAAKRQKTQKEKSSCLHSSEDPSDDGQNNGKSLSTVHLSFTKLAATHIGNLLTCACFIIYYNAFTSSDFYVTSFY